MIYFQWQSQTLDGRWQKWGKGTSLSEKKHISLEISIELFICLKFLQHLTNVFLGETSKKKLSEEKQIIYQCLPV